MPKKHADAPARREPTSAYDEASFALVSVGYDPAQRELIAQMEAAVAQRLASKPRRLAHSRSVARTAEAMAVRYGADPFEARLAGTLHDWDKVLTPDEQLAKARELGIDLGVPPERVVALLHGMTAAAELGTRYPMLSASVLQAIARHTIGAADMTPLDMVIFVADVIEPRRHPTPAIEAERAMVVSGVALDEVYRSAFTRGIIYVIETGRYLYPGTIDIYNALVARGDGGRKRKGAACPLPPLSLRRSPPWRPTTRRRRTSPSST